MIDKKKYSLNSYKIDYIIVAFSVLIYPLIVVPIYYDSFRLPRYIVLSLIALMTILCMKKKGSFNSIDNRLLNNYLIYFLITSFISTLLSKDLITSLTGYAYRYTGFFTILFCVVLFLHTRGLNISDYSKLLNLMIICSVFISIIAVLQYFGFDIIPKNRSFYIAYGTMENPNDLGTYTAFILPAAVIMFSFYKKNIYIISVSLIFAGLLVSLTRGAWLAFSLVFLFLLLQYRNDAEIRKRLFCCIFIFSLITVLFINTRHGLISNRMSSIPGQVSSAVNLEDNAGSLRVYVWKNSVKYIPRYWAFGVGPDNIKHLEIRWPTDNRIVTKTHNIYLEMLLSMGLFAFTAYFLFILTILFNLYKLKATQYSCILFYMILVYLIQGLFNFDVLEILPLFWIVLALSSRVIENSAQTQLY